MAHVLGKTSSGAGSAPLYRAPEEGKSSDVDPRNDVYAMGGVLFHMLTGRPPFSAGTDRLTAKRPSASKIRSYVPKAIDRAIAVALAKKTANRFPSMREFATEVAQIDDLDTDVSSKLADVAATDIDAFARTAARREIFAPSASGSRWALLVAGIVLVGAIIVYAILSGG